MSSRENPSTRPAEPRAGIAGWRRAAVSPWTAGAILALFWIAQVALWWDRGFTYDEPGHALGGYSYWKFGDYRMDPENGNLPQRLAGLGLLAAGIPAPDVTTEGWRQSDEWRVSHAWIFESRGADPARFRRAGRAAMALLSVALAALVWWWSRRLFGPWGGLVSLVLCVFSPMLLANGPLVTSDIAAAAGFLAATGAYWALLHRVSPGRVLLAGVATALLFLCKMSAVLLIPIAAGLLVVRLVRDEPLPCGNSSRAPRLVASRGRRAAWLAGATVAQALVAWAILWAAYGFRFAAFAPELAAGSRHPTSIDTLLGEPRPYQLLDAVALTDAQTARAVAIFQRHGTTSEDWNAAARVAVEEVSRDVLEPAQRATLERTRVAAMAGWVPRAIHFCHDHRLLPEAFLIGTAHARFGAQGRVSFLDGTVHPAGSPDYFPLTLLYKNPLSVFALGVLAAVGAWFHVRRLAPAERRAWWYALWPLGLLIVGFWAFLIPSTLNIGHRHALPVYPPFFILCGAAAGWWTREPRGNRRAGWLVPAALATLALEVVSAGSNQLGYVSPLAGGSRNGYRHLCDSSIDWGQELPAVRRHLDALGPTEPVFFSYFGNDSPRQHGIQARLLPSFASWDNDARPAIALHVVPRAGQDSFLEWLRVQQPDFELLAMADSGASVECAVIKRAETLRLTGGLYLISAGMLQPIDYRGEGPVGPWCARHEAKYQELRAIVAPMLMRDEAARQAMLDRHSVDQLAAAYPLYDLYRFHRLTAWLRRREPDTVISGAVLAYRLTGDDIQQALEAPPVELGPDLLAEYQARFRAPAK